MSPPIPPAGDMNLPYESQDETHLDDTFFVSAGVVIMAATSEGQAALVLRFAHADGSGFAHPVLLILKDHEMAALVPLVEKATSDAINAARRQR
jgi:hypothetical protein